MNVLEIENIGKLYRLGLVTHQTFADDMKRLYFKIRGKNDPFSEVGTINDRTTKADGDYVWALRNVSLNVSQGDVIGIIGSNGAGKSTLLKLLSRVTSPTEGTIRIKGRVASLLEVGTGFHTELTGRENIFLNGAILGMTKREIRSKFDEIVAFSGVEKYVDTPVKRYSSGMLVRLGFAIAAHLEPEILIVDEVLAVGDIEFQKKCLGKMQDVSEEGRTILFVSHNMSSVRSLCKSGIVLSNGGLVFEDSANLAVEHYLSIQKAKTSLNQSWEEGDAPGNTNVKLLHYRLNQKRNSVVLLREELKLDLEFLLKKEFSGRLDVSVEIKDESMNTCFVVGTGSLQKLRVNAGRLGVSFSIENSLNIGLYTITVRVVENKASHAILRLDDVISFEIAQESEADDFVKTRGPLLPNYKVDSL